MSLIIVAVLQTLHCLKYKQIDPYLLNPGEHRTEGIEQRIQGLLLGPLGVGDIGKLAPFKFFILMYPH